MAGTYDPKTRETHWQKIWEEKGIYHFRDDLPREQTFVIDTPPPTVSGVLHMGHIFSYTQADFIARFQRMRGKDVFYPMGFDDNGLPTERLVEKVKGVRATQMAAEENGREKFVNLCREVVAEAEEEFKKLFQSVALSVDWNQLYQTVSDEVTALSQASFLDLIEKGEAYRDFRPTYWDWVDQTAIAQAEIENKEMPGIMSEIVFTLEDGEPLIIMTTRPELLGACVAVMYHSEDPNALKYKGKHAITPLFGVRVPMIADDAVERDKGTGLVMCCTFGDDTDKEWQREHELPRRTILGLDGKISVISYSHTKEITGVAFSAGQDGREYNSKLTADNTVDINITRDIFAQIKDLKPKQANAKMIELLHVAGKLHKQTPITHSVKCAERSGTPIEIIPTYQWFVRICDKKEQLLEKGARCEWKPDYMRIRLNQWIEGLKEDWCISRQRFFGVPFPIWYGINYDKLEQQFQQSQLFDMMICVISASMDELPVDPLQAIPKEYRKIDWPANRIPLGMYDLFAPQLVENIETGERWAIWGDKDVMDTWATSSITPQINAHEVAGYRLQVTADRPQAKTYNLKPETSAKLFPADLRPQAHEIIRTWAFYTMVKAHLHADSIPWRTLMISGWCLASDKSKMSKSKGNVVTPVALIEDKGADAVRYWASTSRLGADTAFSEDLLKIGRKLVNKLFNASSFVSTVLEASGSGLRASASFSEAQSPKPEALDAWILLRLDRTIKEATECFEAYEYADAKEAIERFFWRDFCDNYLELVKARAYGESSLRGAGGDEAIHGSPRDFVARDDEVESARVTLRICLNTILKLFAPFVPHITEELFAEHFADEHAVSGSIHARGMWPAPMSEHIYSGNETNIESLGEAAIELLEAIRKIKSEKNISIKFPIQRMDISKSAFKHEIKALEPILGDVKAAGNVEEINLLDSELQSGTLTYNNNFKVIIEMATTAG